MDDELDIYEDLDDFQEAENKKCKELEAVQAKCEAVQQEFANLQAENKVLSKKIKTMEVNFQNLLDTAKAEIKRKDVQITQLRKEKDDLCFRRKRPNNNQPPDVVERQEHKRFKREEPPAITPEIIMNNNNENWIGLQKADNHKHSKSEHKTQPQVAHHENKKIHKHENPIVASETSRHRPADDCRTHDRDRDRDRDRERDKNKDHRRHRSRSRDNKRETNRSKNSTHRHRTSSKDSKRNRHSRSRSPSRTATSHHKTTYPDSIKHRERNKKHHLKTIKTDKHNNVRTMDTLFGSTPKKTEELSTSAISEIVMEKLIANVDSSTSQEMYTPPAQTEHKIEQQKHEEVSLNSPQTIDEVDMYFVKSVKDVKDAVEEVPNREAYNGKPLDRVDNDSSSEKPMNVLDDVKEPKAMETEIEPAETVSEEICTDKEERIPGLDLIDKNEETDNIGQVLSNEEIPELDFNAEEEIVIQDNAETDLHKNVEEEVIEGNGESETVLNENVEEEVDPDDDGNTENVLNENEVEEVDPDDDNTENVLNENVEEEVVEDDDTESVVNYDQEVNKDDNEVKIYEESQINDEDQENVNDDDTMDEDVNDENGDTTKEHIPGLDLIVEHNSDNEANDLKETSPTADMNINAEEETTEKVESSQPNEEDIPDGNLKEEEELANDELNMSELEITDNVNNNQDPAPEYEDIISNELPQEVEAEYNQDCKPDEALNECENMTENVEITVEYDKKSTESDLTNQLTEAKQLIEINSPETQKPDTSQLPPTPTNKLSSTPSSTLSTSQEECMITPKLPKRAMRGIQIIEDIRLPVKMDIKQMSVTVKEKLPDDDSNDQRLQLPDISVGQIVTINKSVSELSADTPPIVMYVQPDSTKIDHNDDEDAVLEAVMNELILEKPQPSDLNESYPNLSLETDTIEMALEQLHHHSPIDGQPDETTVSSTSMKGYHNPKPDLVKILTQTPNSKQQQMDLEKSRRGPSTVRIRIKSMNACSTNEGMSPECKKKLSLTPEKPEKSPHKKRKLHESPKHKLMTPDATVVPATPPDEPMTIESSPQHVTLDETNISDSSLNQSADTSIVLKRCSMGNSDYQYEKVNDEVILRVTRRPRRRRPVAVAELNESVTTDTTDETS